MEVNMKIDYLSKFSPAVFLLFASIPAAQAQSVNCTNQTTYTVCKINENGYPTISTKQKNVEPKLIGQTANAAVVIDTTQQRDTAALINQVRDAQPEPLPTQSEYTFGPITHSILSCDELNAIKNYTMKNPKNPQESKRVINGKIIATADSSGWYAVPFDLYGVTGTGGAFAWRQPAYKDGVFHHWVGFTEESSKQGSWNLSLIGLCESQFNYDEKPQP